MIRGWPGVKAICKARRIVVPLGDPETMSCEIRMPPELTKRRQVVGKARGRLRGHRPLPADARPAATAAEERRRGVPLWDGRRIPTGRLRPDVARRVRAGGDPLWSRPGVVWHQIPHEFCSRIGELT